MTTPPQFTFTIPPNPSPSRRNKPLWLIGIGLCANALILLHGHLLGQSAEFKFNAAAFAQSAPPPGGSMLGARGFYMMPAQLGPNTFGVYLMDVDSSTICVYKVSPDSSKIKLMATRSFQNDRFIPDFNNEKPLPREVQQMVEDQRKRQDLHQKDDVSTVDQAPKPDENLPDPAPAVAPR